VAVMNAEVENLQKNNTALHNALEELKMALDASQT